MIGILPSIAKIFEIHNIFVAEKFVQNKEGQRGSFGLLASLMIRGVLTQKRHDI